MLSFHKVKHCWLLCLYICIYLHNNITNKQMQISWVGRPRNCSKKYEVLHPYQVISIGHFEQQFFEFILVSDPLETKSNQMEPRSPRYCYPRGICISCDTIFHMKPPQKDKKRCVKGWEGSRSQRKKEKYKITKLLGRVWNLWGLTQKHKMCDVTGRGGSSIATAPWTIIVLPLTGYVIDAVFSGLILDPLCTLSKKQYHY